MSDICKVAGGNLEWKIGEKWYELSQLKMKEIRDFATWARNRRIKESIKDLEVLKIATPENKYKIMEGLPREGDLTSLIFSELLTAEGLAHGLYLSIRRNDPTVTPEMVLEEMQIRKPKDIEALNDFIVTGVLPEAKKDKDSEEDKAGEGKNAL